VVCADEDAERMRALYSVAAEKLLVIPNGYDETRVRPATPEERRRARARFGIADADYVSLFLGSDVPHNRAALRVLIEQAMPPVAAITSTPASTSLRAMSGSRAKSCFAH